MQRLGRGKENSHGKIGAHSNCTSQLPRTIRIDRSTKRQIKLVKSTRHQSNRPIPRQTIPSKETSQQESKRTDESKLTIQTTIDVPTACAWTTYLYYMHYRTKEHCRNASLQCHKLVLSHQIGLRKTSGTGRGHPRAMSLCLWSRCVESRR